MRYAVIFTRNDGWTGVTTIEAIKPTYDEAMVEAEKVAKDIMKTQHLKGSVQDNIKNGKIEFTEEKLYQKTIESVSYYHRTEKENALYFRQGRVVVNKTVYSYSNIGDSFYIVFFGIFRRFSAVRSL